MANSVPVLRRGYVVPTGESVSAPLLELVHTNLQAARLVSGITHRSGDLAGELEQAEVAARTAAESR